MSNPVVRVASFDQLSARTFHDIAKLRLDAFVVEQSCPYPELDGRDVLPTTRHLWVEEDGEVAAYLRLFPGAEESWWIGRVVTAVRHRGRGLAASLMHSALAAAPRPLRISAQAQLEPWYAGFGFTRCGDDFLDEGILHVPMALGRRAHVPS